MDLDLCGAVQNILGTRVFDVNTMPRSERSFPSLKDVMREFLTLSDWLAIFGPKSGLSASKDDQSEAED